jgi:predicted nucleotidyltransferase component of viral defense system
MLLDKTIDEAIANEPNLVHLIESRKLIGLHLLRHDVIKALNDDGILKNLTLKGSSSLLWHDRFVPREDLGFIRSTSCLGSYYGLARLSKDLDFAGTIDFSEEGLSKIEKIIGAHIGNKYGFKVSASLKAKKEENNVKTLNIKIIVGSKDINNYNIKIDICSRPPLDAHSITLSNPFGVDMETNGLIIQAQSLEEMYVDKIIAIADRPTLLGKDIWDILLLRHQKIYPNIKLLPLKLRQQNLEINNFLQKLQERFLLYIGSLPQSRKLREDIAITQKMSYLIPLSNEDDEELLLELCAKLSKNMTSLLPLKQSIVKYFLN